MKLPLPLISLAAVLVCFNCVDAQKRRAVSIPKVREPRSLTVIDETLSVLRTRPSLFAEPIQRMRRGRVVRIFGTAEADGVKFFRIASTTGQSGWIQSDSLFGRARSGDEERFARLIHAADGFDQIELANAFFGMFPASGLRAPILLLFGDLIEDAAVKLSRDAGSRLRPREMAASGAPIHSFFLNFSMLDRYRRLGVRFFFNPNTRRFHYDGASWREIVGTYPTSVEAGEAQKRLDSLRLKLQARADTRK